MKTTLVLNLLLALLTACSVEITEVTPVPSPNLLVTPTALALQPPGIESLTPLSSTPTPGSTMPLPAINLNLTGHLLFFKYEPDSHPFLVKFDLTSGALTTLYHPPDKAGFSDAAISPDGTQLVMIYAPPPPPGQQRPSEMGLYVMPTECASRPEGCGSEAPSPLLKQNDRELFVYPVWSPDGQYIYYSHFVYEGDLDTSDYTIERIAYPAGQPEVLVENALWPSLSPDGTKLAYFSFDPANFTEMLNVAEANGANPKLVIPANAFSFMDDHFFSPDGSAIIFSAPGNSAAVDPSWLERLLGIQTASAHGLPADWWRVPVQGGQPERLTQISAEGLYGAFAPDGRHIAFVDFDGVYIMKPDGTEILQLLSPGGSGMLQWQE